MVEEIVMIVANYDGGDGNDEQLQYECLLLYQKQFERRLKEA